MANKALCDDSTADGPVPVAVAAAVELPDSPSMDKPKVMKTPLHLKTASVSSMPKGNSTGTEEPTDSNAAEPIWYVAPPAPPAPLHHNPSSRRSSATPAVTMPLESPGFMSPTTSSFLNDFNLDLDHAMFESPKNLSKILCMSPPTSSADATGAATTFVPTATTTSALSEALYTPMDTTTMTTIWPSNATTEIQFSLESPPLEIEMENFGHFSSHYGQKQRQQQQQQQPQASSTPSFFTGFFSIPPSLAGRPQLTDEQQDYIRREYQRGPVPLMWPKEDIENQQPTESSQPQNTVDGAGGGWFSSWWASSSTTPTKPVETRREGAMAQ